MECSPPVQAKASSCIHLSILAAFRLPVLTDVRFASILPFGYRRFEGQQGQVRGDARNRAVQIWVPVWRENVTVPPSCLQVLCAQCSCWCWVSAQRGFPRWDTRWAKTFLPPAALWPELVPGLGPNPAVF